MKTGKNIHDLAAAVQLVADNKRDFIVPAERMSVFADNTLEFDGQNVYGIRPVFHDQLATKLDIPKAYYERMREEAPILWTDNVNTWLQKSTDNRLIRTVQGDARAFLSDRYRPLDNDLILNTVLPILADYPELQILSSEVTEKRLYLQVVFPRLQGEVKKGDVVQSGLIVSNSEVGLGSVNISPLIYRLVCLNGMIRESAMKKYHIGKKEDADWIAADTRTADNAAFLLRIRDTVRETLSVTAWNKTLQTLQAAAEQPLEKPMKTVEEVTKKYSMPATSKQSLLQNLIEGGDLSQWGLANAVTRMSNTIDDYDASVEYEKIGGKIIDLTPTEWKQMNA